FDRLLLRPDGADLVGAADGIAAGFGTGLHHGRHRAPDAREHGSASVKRFGDFFHAGMIGAYLIVLSFLRPIGVYDEGPVYFAQFPLAQALLIVAAIGVFLGEYRLRRLAGGKPWAIGGPIVLVIGALALIIVPTAELQMGWSAQGFWLALAG